MGALTFRLVQLLGCLTSIATVGSLETNLYQITSRRSLLQNGACVREPDPSANSSLPFNNETGSFEVYSMDEWLVTLHYLEANELDINDCDKLTKIDLYSNLAIDGPLRFSQDIYIEGGCNSRVTDEFGNVTLVPSRCKFDFGGKQGVSLVRTSHLTIINVEFRDAFFHGSGGAVRVGLNAEFTATDTTFTRNTANLFGGVALVEGIATFRKCEFSFNEANSLTKGSNDIYVSTYGVLNLVDIDGDVEASDSLGTVIRSPPPPPPPPFPPPRSPRSPMPPLRPNFPPYPVSPPPEWVAELERTNALPVNVERPSTTEQNTELFVTIATPIGFVLMLVALTSLYCFWKHFEIDEQGELYKILQMLRLKPQNQKAEDFLEEFELSPPNQKEIVGKNDSYKVKHHIKKVTKTLAKVEEAEEVARAKTAAAVLLHHKDSSSNELAEVQCNADLELGEASMNARFHTERLEKEYSSSAPPSPHVLKLKTINKEDFGFSGPRTPQIARFNTGERIEFGVSSPRSPHVSGLGTSERVFGSHSSPTPPVLRLEPGAGSSAPKSHFLRQSTGMSTPKAQVPQVESDEPYTPKSETQRVESDQMLFTPEAQILQLGVDPSSSPPTADFEISRPVSSDDELPEMASPVHPQILRLNINTGVNRVSSGARQPSTPKSSGPELHVAKLNTSERGSSSLAPSPQVLARLHTVGAVVGNHGEISRIGSSPLRSPHVPRPDTSERVFGSPATVNSSSALSRFSSGARLPPAVPTAQPPKLKTAFV